MTFSLGLGNGPIVGYAAEGLFAQGRWEGLLGASVSVETASRNARIGRWGGGGVAALDGGGTSGIYLQWNPFTFLDRSPNIGSIELNYTIPNVRCKPTYTQVYQPPLKLGGAGRVIQVPNGEKCEVVR